MLLYGNATHAKFIEGGLVYNFTSMVEKYPRLPLMPPNYLGASSEYDFDQKYMEFVMFIDQNFINFMSYIIMPLYNGHTIYLCISEDPWSEIIIESLLKLIQQRYGYNATRINDFNDLCVAESSDFEPRYGLSNLDQDKDRYSYAMEQLRQSAGYKPYGGGNWLC